MQTIRLYETDSHLRTFEAEVVACRAEGRHFAVELDRTCFYPEGGGQPGDTGVIGGVRVTDTHAKDGAVIHFCEQPLAVGSHVTGEIDFERRFSFMQQHSGEHILSGLIHKHFGYENVGFHMGADAVTIDFNGELTQEQLDALEREANMVIWSDVPVLTRCPSAQELETIPFRSKKALTGQVRIVTIPGADICACCGTHVSHTGEIGLLVILSCVRFHEGVRMEILCGAPAFDYVRTVMRQNRQVSGLLSARPSETAQAAARLLDEHHALKARVSGLERQHFSSLADSFAGSGDVLLFEPELSPDGVRQLADLVMHACGGRAAVFSGADGAGYRYAVAQEDGDLRALTHALNEALHGRGGGKPFFVQGSVQAGRAEIEAFFAAHAEGGV